MGEIIQSQPGDVIIQEGDHGTGCYILKQGVLDVVKEDVKLGEISTPATIFGEMSDILGKPRTCSVIARTEAKVIHITESIDEIVRTNPRLTRRLLSDIAQRLEATNEKLVNTAANLLWAFEKPPGVDGDPGGEEPA